MTSAFKVQAQTNTITEPTPTQRTVALNEPAVVLINTLYNATYTFTSATYTRNDQGQFVFTAHPEKGVETDPISLGSWGSGFIITPDGYLMTNAHVGTSQLLKDSFVDQLASAVAQAKVQDGSITQDEMGSFAEALLVYLNANAHFDNELTIVTVAMGVVAVGGPVKNLKATGIAADLKSAGRWDGKDVAVLKINVDYPLPTVKLGDSESVAPGDPVVVIGYPGIVSELQNIGGIESIEPTATAGIVSAIKTEQTAEGQFNMIQTDASIHHGNSGGPGFNAQGEVVGIASLAAGNPNEPGQELSNVGFLLPINTAMEFSNQISVKNIHGPLDTYWEQGLDYYWAHHYTAAIQQFQKVESLYPGHPYADRYIRLSQNEIAKGNDLPLQPLTTGSGLQIDTTTMIIIPVVVAVAVVTIVLVTKRRRAPAVSGPSAVPVAFQGAAPAPTAEHAFCINCGNQIPANAVFCRKCGAKQF